METRIFVPQRIDDLASRCRPYIGKEVTVESWHSNLAMKDRYPDDVWVGYVKEFAADIPGCELLESFPCDSEEMIKLWVVCDEYGWRSIELWRQGEGLIIVAHDKDMNKVPPNLY